MNWPPDWIGRDLAANLLAGSIDVVFTVSLLAWALKRQETSRTFAARFGAYLQCRMLLVKFESVWFNMIKASSDMPPSIGDDLLSDQGVWLLRTHLDLDADAGHSPPRTWEVHLLNYCADIKGLTSEILTRWGSVLSPTVLTTILEIERSSFYTSITAIPAYRSAMKLRGLEMNSLIVRDDFAGTEAKLYYKLSALLKDEAREFSRLDDYFQPPDLAFKEQIERLQQKDNIEPKLGSARLLSPADARSFFVGRGLPSA